MNRIALALLLVGATALAAGSARAESRVSIGVNIGSPGYYPPAPVVVAPPTVVYAPPPAVIVAPPRGYWKEVPVKVWVPERWVVRTNRWGRPERYCEPGYYTYRTDRVWIADRGHGHGYAYGYGRDNRGWNR